MALKSSFVFLAVFGIHFAHAMDCSLGTSDNVIEQFIRTCPRPLIDSKDESYCCWSPSGDKVHCCNLTDFVFNGISILLPFIIICLVLSFIVSCICCLCCPCCCFYKRRSGGSLEQLQLQQQQVWLQQQQVQLQQQQLELELQRQQLLVQKQAMGMVEQLPPPYTASAPEKKNLV